jgi:cell division protein FtsI/penicillin-binding protein 2
MKNRITFLKFFFSLILIYWVIALAILQSCDPHNLAKRKKDRYNTEKDFIVANRGNIYDRNGNLLVGSQKLYQIDIDRERLETVANNRKQDIDTIFLHIDDIFTRNSNLSQGRTYDRLRFSRARSPMISDSFTEEQMQLIKTEMVKAGYGALTVTFASLRRIYPRENLASRLLGITESITDDSRHNRYTFRLRGSNGIERTCDRDLAGNYGWREVMLSPSKKILPFPSKATKDVVHGASVYLTINMHIQEILENNLRKGINTFGAKTALGVIMNPHNGEVIAMAGLKREDIARENRGDFNSIRAEQNLPIQHWFEPGSTIKPFVSLIALDKNVAKESEMFECKPWNINYGSGVTRTIRCTHERGNFSFRDVIVQSCNVATARIADRIGSRDLYRYYINLGFGSSTKIDLDFESSGKFSKLSDWSAFTLHSVSFGQEISVTALQLATAFCALANGGYVLRPSIISKKVDIDNNVYGRSQRKVLKTISNRKNIELNNSFMLDVVERGTGTNTRFRNIKIAGKTGTSERTVATANTRATYTASFAGFFPYENPEYVMVIVYDEPDHRFRFGSTSAVVSFKNIVEEMLTVPDCSVAQNIRANSQELITMPNVTGLKVDDAKKLLKNNQISFRIINELADNVISQQFPKQGTRFGSNNRVTLYASKNQSKNEARNEPIIEDRMPNLVGLSLRDAINVSKEYQINLSIEGSGHIVSQNIRPGERIRTQQRCLVVAR